MNIDERLSKVTYAMQHSPNCPSSYLVRLIGKDQGHLDFNQSKVETRDVCGYGVTFHEAAEDAFKKCDTHC